MFKLKSLATLLLCRPNHDYFLGCVDMSDLDKTYFQCPRFLWNLACAIRGGSDYYLSCMLSFPMLEIIGGDWSTGGLFAGKMHIRRLKVRR